MKEFLEQLCNSLCRVEIKGKENMDIMLGCILAIESKIAELNAPQETEETDGN